MTGSPIIPTLRYRNSPAMVDWLCETFGFEKHLVVDSEDGGIAHAQLTFGSGMIMLGSHGDDAFGQLQGAPDSKTGPVTQSPYIVVDDVDVLCERAKAAGAEIVYGPNDEDYGGRGFSCRDPEGHLWNFGSYDPWAG